MLTACLGRPQSAPIRQRFEVSTSSSASSSSSSSAAAPPIGCDMASWICAIWSACSLISSSTLSTDWTSSSCIVALLAWAALRMACSCTTWARCSSSMPCCSLIL